MIRCVAYYGEIRGALARGEVERIAGRSQSRNARLGITGCLFFFGGHYVQVLEGGYEEVDRLYGTFASDAPEPDVIGLVDNLIAARVFPNWSIKRIEGADPSVPPATIAAAEPPAAPLPPITDRPAQPGSLELLARDLDRRVARHLRVAPRQARARQTVARLLDAIDAMIAASGSIERLSLEAAAASAGVTQQSAYRYFANIDDLIRAAVRRMQAHWHARFLDFMAERTFASEAAAAEAVVAFIVGTHDSQIRAAGRLKRDLLRDYHDVAFDAAWTVAETVVRAIAAGSPRLRLGVAEMATGLTALWAVAKSVSLEDGDALARPEIRQLMTDMFLAAMNAPRRGESDGLARPA